MTGKYVAGPYLLVKPGDRLPADALSVSSCLADAVPDSWAIEWAKVEDAERVERAARVGISSGVLPKVIEWATEHFDGGGFAWPNVFLDLEVAREFQRRFLTGSIRLLQISLPQNLVESFLSMAGPPPQQPGYAPVGATGVYEALSARNPLTDRSGVRGFEVLGYDSAGRFESFRGNGLETELQHVFNIQFNQWGLIEDEATALQCAEYANDPQVSTCATVWHPWLIVEHSL